MKNEAFAMISYLIAAIFFILALRGLSSPTSARSGNIFGMVGMAVAIITTLLIGTNLVSLLIGITSHFRCIYRYLCSLKK